MKFLNETCLINLGCKKWIVHQAPVSVQLFWDIEVTCGAVGLCLYSWKERLHPGRGLTRQIIGYWSSVLFYFTKELWPHRNVFLCKELNSGLLFLWICFLIEVLDFWVGVKLSCVSRFGMVCYFFLFLGAIVLGSERYKGWIGSIFLFLIGWWGFRILLVNLKPH